MMDKLKGYRTMVVALATSLTGALAALGVVDFDPQMIVDVWDYALLLMGAVFALLRVVTNGPVGGSSS